MIPGVTTLILPSDATSLDTVLGDLTSEVPVGIPDMVRADGEQFAIIIADPSASSDRSYDARAVTAGTTVVLAVGLADQLPTGGTFSLSYSSDSTGLAALAYNITPVALAAALNANPTRAAAGPVSVVQVGNDYIISDTTVGARAVLVANGSQLIPLSSATISEYRIGSSGQYEVQILTLAQAPQATSTTYSALPAAGYTLATVTVGTGGTPAVQLLTLTGYPYGGTFTIDGFVIQYDANAQQFANAYGAGVASVVQVGEFSWQYTMATNGAFVSTVSVANLLCPTGFLMTLNLSTYEMLLAFAASAADPIALEISFQYTTPGELPKTALLASVNIYRSVINTSALVASVSGGVFAWPFGFGTKLVVTSQATGTQFAVLLDGLTDTSANLILLPATDQTIPAITARMTPTGQFTLLNRTTGNFLPFSVNASGYTLPQPGQILFGQPSGGPFALSIVGPDNAPTPIISAAA